MTELVFLPAYAPDKNPVEYKNGHAKRLMSALAATENQKEYENLIRNIMRKIQSNRKLVQKYFDHPEIAYARR